MGLAVIGAGLPRTGTTSLAAALAVLGIGPAYHLGHLSERPSDLALWEAGEWGRLFDGYAAALDYPACCRWRELAAAYPRAKVILTTRDPAAWYDSIAATLYARTREATDGVAGALARDLWGREFHHFMDRPEMAQELFAARNAAVQLAGLGSRLLVYDMRDGWPPLCAFLGMPVPAVAFPWLNLRREWHA